jgi:hypothetical protein
VETFITARGTITRHIFIDPRNVTIFGLFG